MVVKTSKKKIQLGLLFFFLGLMLSSFFVTAAFESPQYFSRIDKSFNLTEKEKDLLEKNNFVVINRKATDDILDAYIYYWEEDLPIMITTDAMLHLWHLYFDEILVEIETSILYPCLELMINAMYHSFIAEVEISSNNLAYFDVATYLAVAAKICDSEFTPSLELTPTVNTIYNAIMDEITLFDAAASFSSLQLSRFIDDFSQYKPRGHYTRSEELKIYFRLFKWLSRIPFFYEDFPGNAIVQRTPEEMINSSISLAWTMENTDYRAYKIQNQIYDLPDFDGLSFWTVFDSFLDSVVGKSYGITPLHILTGSSSILNSDTWHFTDFTIENIQEIKDLILNDPTISHPQDFSTISLSVEEIYSSPKTFYFIGERLMLDTYALNHMVNPYIYGKSYPSGLEFAAILLNSNHALDLLDSPYEQNILDLRVDLAAWTEEDKKSIAWQWYDNLEELSYPYPKLNNETNVNIPSFMASDKWLNEKMTTILGSWAQLKHDTILYAKMGWGQPFCSTPMGYVEPYPDFYMKLGEMAGNYYDVIENFSTLEVSEYQMDDFQYAQEKFTEITAQLSLIASKTLLDEAISKDDKDFLQNTFYRKEDPYGGPTAQGWLPQLLRSINGKFSGLSKAPNSHSSLIADIHTNAGTQQTLEIASGLLEHLIAIVPGWDGKMTAVVGPVFSYYEFTAPMDQRMTDEEWRGIIYAEGTSFDYRGSWADSYMSTTAMPKTYLFDTEIDKDEYTSPEWYTQSNNIMIESAYNEIHMKIDSAYQYGDYPPVDFTSSKIQIIRTTMVLIGICGFIGNFIGLGLHKDLLQIIRKHH